MRRILVVSALLASVGFVGCGGQSEPPHLKFLPMTLGAWKGEQFQPLPEEVRRALKCEASVDRIYRGDLNHPISIHLATFPNWSDGLTHDPIRLYGFQGWKLLANTTESLDVEHRGHIRVDLSTWERDADQIMVLYWYQVGDRVLFHQSDLAELRPEIRNQESRSPLVKVQLHTRVSTSWEAKQALMEFAELIADWLARSGHIQLAARMRSRGPIHGRPALDGSLVAELAESWHRMAA